MRDADSAARARLLKAIVWGGVPGLVFGVLTGIGLASSVPGLWVVPAFLAGLLAPPVAIVGFALLASAGAGRLAGTVHAPAGHGGPTRRPYSAAEALLIQGRPHEAADLYALHASEHPSEPEPYLRLARIHRDQLGEPEEAARWFRLARERSRLNEGQERLLARELIELYRDRLRDPVRAAPELARLAEHCAGTAEGAWAAAELADVKRTLAERRGQDRQDRRGDVDAEAPDLL